MNNETPKQASYGEPLRKFGLAGIETSQGHLIAAAVNDPMRERIINCVNACAGIADPEKAIQATREALTLAANRLERLQIECEYGKSIRFNAAEWVQETRAALAQLNATK